MLNVEVDDLTYGWLALVVFEWLEPYNYRSTPLKIDSLQYSQPKGLD